MRDAADAPELEELSRIQPPAHVYAHHRPVYCHRATPVRAHDCSEADLMGNARARIRVARRAIEPG